MSLPALIRPLFPFALLLATALAGARLDAQGAYLSQAVANGLAAAREVKDVSGFGPRSSGLCIVGGWTAKGGELAFKVRLRKGNEYIFIGSGDADAQAMDLTALEDGKAIAKDADEDATPLVRILAEADTELTLRLKLRRCKESHAFAVLTMLDNTKVKGKLENLERAAAQLRTAVEAAKEGTDLEIDPTDNTISFAGMLLEPGASMSFDRDFGRKAEYLVVGSADGNCKDLDLTVTKDGDSVSDDEEDATPIVHFTVAEKGRASVKLTAHEAKGRTFAVCSVLSKPKG